MITVEPDLEAIRKRAEAATEGPWEMDHITNEGSYGCGDDTHEGFHSFQIITPNGKSIGDTLNAEMAEVHEEFDEDGYSAWDEVGRKNFDFIAHARQDIPALLAILQRDRERIAELHNSLQALLHWSTRDENGDKCDQLEGLPDGHGFSVIWEDGPADFTAGQVRRARATLGAKGE